MIHFNQHCLAATALCCLAATLGACANTPVATAAGGAMTARMPSHAAYAVAACGLTEADAQRVQTLVQAMVARGHAPGAVVDVRCQGRPWLHAAHGLSDVARGRPMQLDSLFRIYSMTKPITSVLVLMLAEEGRLSIDDPVARHLPEFASTAVHSGSAVFPPETVAAVRPVTVRDLLRHTAGLTYISAQPDPVSRLYVQRGIDHGAGNKITPADGSAPVDSSAELSRRIAALPMLAQPGTRFSYGNATDILGRLVEVLTGQALRQAMAERLLQPLALHDTGFQVPSAQLGRLTAAYAAPAQTSSGQAVLRRAEMQARPASQFSLADDPPSSVFAAPRALDFGGAGLVSTAADYQRFLQLLLQPPAAPLARLLRRDSVAAMTLNQVDAPALLQSKLALDGLGFGLGVATFLEPERAPVAVPRDGYFWGGAASTYFWVDPARGISGVLLTQVFGGDVGPYFTALLDTLYSAKR